MAPAIAKTHIADLSNKYQVQGLDISELRAVYAALPAEFENDRNGAKAQWRAAARARPLSHGAATYRESTRRRYQISALARRLIDSPRVLETRSAVDVETTPSVRERAALRARATPTGRRPLQTEAVGQKEPAAARKGEACPPRIQTS